MLCFLRDALHCSSAAGWYLRAGCVHTLNEIIQNSQAISHQGIRCPSSKGVQFLLIFMQLCPGP